MKGISRITLLLILLGSIGLIFPISPIEAQTPGGTRAPAVNVAPGDPAKGKALFTAHQCWACHGYNGETGTRLLQENGTFIARLEVVNNFISFLRAPRPNDPVPVRSLTTMPSYGARSLPDQSAADLFAYIKTLKPTQPALKDIPLLNQMITEGGKLKK